MDGSWFLLLLLLLLVTVSPWIWLLLRGSQISAWYSCSAPDAGTDPNQLLGSAIGSAGNSRRRWFLVTGALICIPFLILLCMGKFGDAFSYPMCWATSLVILGYSWARVGGPNGVPPDLLSVLFLSGAFLGVAFGAIIEGFLMDAWKHVLGSDCSMEEPTSASCTAAAAVAWILTPGLCEETGKAMWLFFRLRRRAGDVPDFCCFFLPARRGDHCGCACWYRLAPTPYHVILAALAAGAGFECAENLLYVFSSPASAAGQQTSTALMRMFTSGLHMAWTGFIGVGLAQHMFYPEMRKPNFLRVFLPPVLLHGLFDFGLMAAGAAAQQNNNGLASSMICLSLGDMVFSYWLLAHYTGARCCCCIPGFAHGSLCCAPGFWDEPFEGAAASIVMPVIGEPVQVQEMLPQVIAIRPPPVQIEAAAAPPS